MTPDSPFRACAPRIAGAVLLALGGATPALADVHATGPGMASATVIAPVAAVPVADLDFGSVGGVALSSGAVTVVPGRDGAAYSGAARAVCTAASGCPRPHPARFEVSGEAGRSYRIGLPASVAARADVDGAAGLEVAGLAALSANEPGEGNRGSLDARGRDSFTVGGTLLLPAGARPARYRARIDVIVAYE